MKITRLIKLAIVAIFVMNSGLVGVIDTIVNHREGLPKYEPFETTTNPKEIELRGFLKERLKQAETKSRYTAEDYLRDNSQYKELLEKLGFPKEEYSAHPDAIKYLGKCQQCLQPYEIGNLHEQMRIIQEKRLEKSDRNFNWIPWLCSLPGYATSLCSFYKSNFVLALLLFGVWYWERRKFPSPLYFLLMVGFYPITIPIILNRRWSAEAEIRRRSDNLFRSLSEEEIERIKKFSLGLLSSAGFREQLKGDPKHSYLLALVATLVIAVIPATKVLAGGPKILLGFSGMALVQTLADDHLARDKISDDKGGLSTDCSKIFWEPIFHDPLLFCARWFSEKSFFRLRRIVFEISHVPKLQAVSELVIVQNANAD